MGRGGSACILIHGFGEGAYVWNRFSPSISQLFRTLSIDLRGHGDSSWDQTGQYPIQRHVTDVVGLIDALQLKRFVIVGHSLRGKIAIRIAAARSSDVIGLTVVDFLPIQCPMALSA
jgi:pimeloyl-ACP methyl ester carboxylesterase